MTTRRTFLSGALASAAAASGASLKPLTLSRTPVVLSTWETGMRANDKAWEILSYGGKALDAVEEGVRVIEDELNCCVGLGAHPDREGRVTLDASIMDHRFNCGSVLFLERIKHPISVARRVMEKTPHVMLAGEGAQQFALDEGFPLESGELSPDAARGYQAWLKKTGYQPRARSSTALTPVSPQNHDTIGMIAIDESGNLSGSCTTSGLAYKMRGRIGDSPIIGAGLYVDNDIGAAVATGQGEDIVRVAGASSIVEAMRRGLSPEKACRSVVEKLARVRRDQLKDVQVCFLALNKQGEYGGFALRSGFSFAVRTAKLKTLTASRFLW